MAEKDPYKIAYEREHKTRLLAEKLLDEKTRTLYSNLVKLEQTVKELESTQEKLIHSEKMASLGQLIAGVAHEINNPIAFALSNLSTLQEYIGSLKLLDEYVDVKMNRSIDRVSIDQYKALREKEDIPFILEDIENLFAETSNGLLRIRDIATNLKKVSFQGKVEKEYFDVNQCIRESLKIILSEYKDRVEIQEELSDLPKILCHASEIHQVLMNMFLNAAYACGTKGVLKIKSYRQKDSEEWVVVEISDNGIGISKETQKKIFDPFFTTKPIGEGTGLGLSVSFGIIDKHGGRIDVWSEEGNGTQFKIFLPFILEP